jgi:hypothetical protein
MANAGYAMPVLEAQEAKATAQALGLQAARLEIWGSEDIAAFEARLLTAFREELARLGFDLL